MEQIIAVLNSTSTINSSIVIQTIQKALSHPKIFGFAELENALSAKLGSNPELSVEAKQWLDMLDIFLYGDYSTYKIHIQESMLDSEPLDSIQLRKLRQLTLLTLASQHTTLGFDMLLEKLGMVDTDDLEKLVIETIYAGIIEAKLYVNSRTVQVSQVLEGRDVNNKRLAEIVSTFEQYDKLCTELIKDMEVHA